MREGHTHTHGYCVGEREGGVSDREGGGLNDIKSDIEGGIVREVYRRWRETMIEGV